MKFNADTLISATLRGESPDWTWGNDPLAVQELLRRADFHGVAALIHAKLGTSDWPVPLLEQLRGRAVALAMWELRHQQLLTEVLGGLAGRGIEPVLIKGTALAYSLYADPGQRTRGDTDLIIPVCAKQAVHDFLVSLGYVRGLGISGELVSYQSSYLRECSPGEVHALDLHWKINNSEVLSRLFTYAELRQRAMQLPRLALGALGTHRVHSLLLACMHRCTHKQNPYYVGGEMHHDANRLIWLYDLHLLAGELTSGDWLEILRAAEVKGLRGVCLESLQQARDHLGTHCPAEIMEGLASSPHREQPARYLAGSKLLQRWMDFQALGGLRAQLRFTREVFLPPASYVRSRYPGNARTWLPWLYLRRAASAATNFIARARA